MPEFDDSNWGSAHVQAGYGAGPWGSGVRPPADTPNPAPMLRKEFSVKNGVRKATAFVAAGGYANVSINGQAISEDVLSPGFTDFDDTVQYVANDVTELVTTGGNAIGVELGRGFYGMTGGNVWNWQKPPWHDEPVTRILLRLELADGTVQNVVTDKSWSIHDGPTLFDDLYGGELFDASKVQPEFNTFGFDDQAWDQAFEAAGPKGVLVNRRQQPIRVTEELPAVEITEPVEDTYVVKFPRVIAGWVEYTAEGPAGTTIRSQAAEKLLPSGLPNFSNNGGFASGFQTDRFVLAGMGAPETWEPQFSYKGFQYIEVKGWPGDQAPKLENFTAKLVHTDAEEWGSFESSEPIMNKVHRAVVDTLKNNIHGIPTDTPMFEKNGWTGDAAVGAEMFMTNLDTHELFAKWMRDVHETRGADGAPEVIAPSSNNWGDTGNWGINPAWHSAYVMIPWWLYQYGNDDRVMTEQYDGMKAYLELEYGRSDKGLVLHPRLGDWVSPEASPAGGNAPEDTRVSATAYLYAMLTSMEKTANYLGKTDDARKFAEQAAVTKETFNATFLDQERGLYRGNGADRGYRQTHNILALAFSLTPNEETAGRVAASLAADIESRGGTLNTGVLGTKYLLPMLSKYGYADVAYELAVSTKYPSWGYIVDNGGTSMWEHWSLEARSLGHYFLGTVDDWFYSGVAGIAASETEGYKRISIAPAVTKQMEWAKAETQTPFGPVSVDWRKKDGNLLVDTHIPVGSVADVRLPAANAWAVTEGGNALTEVEGIVEVRADGDQTIVTVASGDYSFGVDETAGQIGTIIESLDSLDIAIDAPEVGAAMSDADRAALHADTKTVRALALKSLASLDSKSAAAEQLAVSLAAYGNVEKRIAELALEGAPGAAVAAASNAVVAEFGRVISMFLGVESMVDPSTGVKPGDTGSIGIRINNTGDRDIARVKAAATGLGEEWSVKPQVAEVADLLRKGTESSTELALVAPLAATPGKVKFGVQTSYEFKGAVVRNSVASTIEVDSPLKMTSVSVEPATVAPGASAKLVAEISNDGSHASSGRLEVQVPEGWQTPLPSGDVRVAAGETVAIESQIVVPLGAKAGAIDHALTAAFTRGGATLVEGTTSVRVELAAITENAAGYDHVDLGESTSEQAHNLTASATSGTSHEAGVTRRYAGHLTDFSHFEFDMGVVAGKPFMLRATETYDRAQTKRYKVYVDGQEVQLREFAHTGGVGTETYEFLVPAEFAKSDKVRVKFETQNDHGFYDPSIADVWTSPVPSDANAPQVVIRTTPGTPNAQTGWFTTAPVGVEIEAQDDSGEAPAIEYSVNDGAAATYADSFELTKDGKHTVEASAKDAIGNTSEPVQLSVNIDTIAPKTIATLSDDFDAQGVAADKGEVSLVAIDEVAGVQRTKFRVNQGDWAEGDIITLDNPGVHEIEYYSVDVAGNSEAIRSITAEVYAPDRAAPTVSISVSNAGQNGWHVAGAQAAITAADADSDVASIEYQLNDTGWKTYDGPVTLPEGETSIGYRATDAAGNVSSSQELGVRVDATAPGVWGWLSETGRLSALGSDAGSGTNRVEYSLDGTTWGDLSALVAANPAPDQVLVRSFDRAGNVSEVLTLSRSAKPQTLQIAGGDLIVAEGNGFTPGSTVKVELHSKPYLLATAKASKLGTVSVMATVPTSFASGAHSLVFTEQTESNKPGEKPGKGNGSQETPEKDGDSKTPTTTGSKPLTIPTEIAQTGFAVQSWLVGGAVLLVLAAGALVLGVKRQRKQ